MIFDDPVERAYLRQGSDNGLIQINQIPLHPQNIIKLGTEQIPPITDIQQPSIQQAAPITNSEDLLVSLTRVSASFEGWYNRED